VTEVTRLGKGSKPKLRLIRWSRFEKLSTVLLFLIVVIDPLDRMVAHRVRLERKPGHDRGNGSERMGAPLYCSRANAPLVNMRHQKYGRRG
jgi:hypothetical protein